MSHPRLDKDSAYQDFLTWEEKSCQPGLIDPASNEKPLFLPAKVLQQYFKDNNYNNLNKLLRASFPGQEVPVDADKVVEKCTKVFCILLLIGKPEYIQRFMSRDHLQDTHLPFYVNYPPADFPKCTTDQNPKDFLTRFCEKQWEVCAPEIDFQASRQFEEYCILPISVKKKLGGGMSANIYEIELHSTYNQLKNASQGPENRFANKLVLKTYFGKYSDIYFNNEVNAFRKIRSCCASSIIGFYGGFKHGNRCNILLEFADKGTLERYFKEITPPTSGEDINRFWKHLFQLAGALHSIHEVQASSAMSDPRPLQGWHQDVKPANILVSTLGETRKSPFDWEFKLADLGVSHFKRMVSPTESGTDQDSQGTVTYGAPECCRTDEVLWKSKFQVYPTIDIWSLGGVFSEAAAWVVGSHEEVERYRRKRRAATKNIPGLQDTDCFHDGENVLPMVLDYHESLAKRFSPHDCITKQVLHMIENSMLLHETSRSKSIDIWKMSQRILNGADVELKRRRAGSDPSTPITHSRASSSTSSTSTSPAHSRIDSRFGHGGPVDDLPWVLSPLQIYPSDGRDQAEAGGVFSGMGSHRIGSNRLVQRREQSARRMATHYGTLNGTTTPLNLNPRFSPRSQSHDVQSTRPMHNITQSIEGLKIREGEKMCQGSHDWISPERHDVYSMPQPPTTNGLSDEASNRPVNQGSADPTISVTHHIPNSFPHKLYSEVDFNQPQGSIVHKGHFNNGVNGFHQVKTNSRVYINSSKRPTVPMTNAEYNIDDKQDMSASHWIQNTHSTGRPGGTLPPLNQPIVPMTNAKYNTDDNQDMAAAPWPQNTQSMGDPGNPLQPPQQIPLQQRINYSDQSDQVDIIQNSYHNKQLAKPVASASQPDNLPHQDIISDCAEPSNMNNLTSKTYRPPAILSVATAINWRSKRGKIEQLPGSHLFSRLKARDHEFLVDDALSMLPCWDDVESVFDVLAYLLKEADPDGIGLRFTTFDGQFNSKNRWGKNSSTKLLSHVRDRRHKITGTSNITYRLDSILEPYITKLTNAYNLARGGKVRKLNLYVLTDGVWEDECNPSPTIKKLVTKLQEFEYTTDSKQVGIQFISFGNIAKGLKRLKALDDNLGLPMDIVDTTPFNGNVWKMLLGAIDKTFDGATTTA
ncbi:hypothetical protein B0O99DRAFT_675870 [Bisporella sp. PMI_857]|nr:hypothetical protein B0O99DRAFT_675870 [Bisporella sp. PMI_857]